MTNQISKQIGMQKGKQISKQTISKITLSAVMFTLALSACSIKASEPIPAILPKSSVNVTQADLLEVRGEITDIVTKSLGGKKIAIAKDVFHESSRLLIGAKPVVSPSGVMVYDSTNKVKLVFELLKQGNSCLLKRLDTMQSWTLTTSLCVIR
jgi:hypothetical protein